VLLEEVKPSSLAFTLGPTIGVDFVLGKAVFPAKALMHFWTLTQVRCHVQHCRKVACVQPEVLHYGRGVGWEMQTHWHT